MKTMYEMSSWGWADEDKRRSLGQPSARYVVATTSQASQSGRGKVVAFVHYRFEIEDNIVTHQTEAALYVHELQVASWAQGNGLGRRLMEVMEQFAMQAKMDKCMLTVFVYNPAFEFYSSVLGYCEDAGSVVNRVRRNETLELSKPIHFPSERAGSTDGRTSVLFIFKGDESGDSEGHSAPGSEGQRGSVLGAALIYAGTAIGAGMIALPAETAPAGFVPSEISLVACWGETITSKLKPRNSYFPLRVAVVQAGATALDCAPCYPHVAGSRCGVPCSPFFLNPGPCTVLPA